MKKGINVFLSAEETNRGDDGEENWYFEWEQKNPIPSYLFAIVAGDVESRKIGTSNTYVISEPKDLDNYSEILSDLPKMLSTL